MNSKARFISFVPLLLPDQTVYSWSSMFHLLSGNVSEVESRRQLFGTDTSGCHFHIPSHLDTLCATTQLVLGTPEEVMLAATTIPFFIRFRVPSIGQDVLRKIRTAPVAGISQTLGMAKSGPHSFPPRRTCRECIDTDRANHGFAYWHRAHQLPGALACHSHGLPLASFPMLHRRHGKFVWPDQDITSGAAIPNPKRPKNVNASLTRLSVLAKNIADHCLLGGYVQTRMRYACLLVLQDRYPATSKYGFDPIKAAAHYAAHFGAVSSVSELEAITSQRGVSPLWTLVDGSYRRIHPLEWMLILDWLFHDWETFSQLYGKSLE